MRQLFPGGQPLILAGTKEIVSENSNALDVLRMVVENGIKSVERDLPTYVQKARDFDRFPKPVDDNFGLHHLYGKGIVLDQSFHNYLDNIGVVECLESEVLAQATTQARSIGDGVVVAGGIGVEECEKEVFAEFEQDEEREEAKTSQEPRSQTDWDYQLVFDNPSCLFGSVFHQLSDLIEEYGVTEMTAIPWWNGVFCTLNFWETIEKAKECGSLSQYLRLVDPLLVFPDRRVVLISLYELDNLLPLWWGQSCRLRVSIDHVFRLVSNCPQLGYWSLPVSTKALVSLKLFRGNVKYNSDGEKRILRQMLEDLDSPIDTLKQLLSTRSRLSHYEQSDLAKVAFLSSLPRPSPGVKKRPFENREVNTANKKQRSPFVLKGEGARSAQSAIRKQSHSSLLKKISNILKKHRFIDDDAKTQAK